MAAGCQRLRVQIRRPAELRDPLGEPVRVDLLLVGVLEEFVHDCAGVDARRHVEVPLVAQDAYDLGRQGLVEDAQHRLAVRAVAIGHGAVLHVLTGPAAQLLDVADERFRLDHEWLLIVLGHGVLLSRISNSCSRDARRAARPRTMATRLGAVWTPRTSQNYLALLTRQADGYRRWLIEIRYADGTQLATSGLGRKSQKENIDESGHHLRQVEANARSGQTVVGQAH